MDPETQRLIEKTRQRREYLDQKLGKTPEAAPRKRRTPLTEDLTDNVRLGESLGQQDTEDSPKRQCVRGSEQQIKPDTPAIPSVKSRLQVLATQHAHWSEADTGGDDEPAPVPVPRKSLSSPPLERASQPMDYQENAQTGSQRKSRFAQLARSINDWEDDLNHPTVLKKEEEKKPRWQPPKATSAPSTADVGSPKKTRAPLPPAASSVISKASPQKSAVAASSFTKGSPNKSPVRSASKVGFNSSPKPFQPFSERTARVSPVKSPASSKSNLAPRVAEEAKEAKVEAVTMRAVAAETPKTAPKPPSERPLSARLADWQQKIGANSGADTPAGPASRSGVAASSAVHHTPKQACTPARPPFSATPAPEGYEGVQMRPKVRKSVDDEPTAHSVSARMSAWEQMSSANVVSSIKKVRPGECTPGPKTPGPKTPAVSKSPAKTAAATPAASKTPGAKVSPVKTPAPATSSALTPKKSFRDSIKERAAQVNPNSAKKGSVSPVKGTSPKKLGSATKCLQQQLGQQATQSSDMAGRLRQERMAELQSIQNRWKNGILSDENSKSDPPSEADEAEPPKEDPASKTNKRHGNRERARADDEEEMETDTPEVAITKNVEAEVIEDKLIIIANNGDQTLSWKEMCEQKSGKEVGDDVGRKADDVEEDKGTVEDKVSAGMEVDNKDEERMTLTKDTGNRKESGITDAGDNEENVTTQTDINQNKPLAQEIKPTSEEAIIAPNADQDMTQQEPEVCQAEKDILDHEMKDVNVVASEKMDHCSVHIDQAPPTAGDQAGQTDHPEKASSEISTEGQVCDEGATTPVNRTEDSENLNTPHTESSALNFENKLAAAGFEVSGEGPGGQKAGQEGASGMLPPPAPSSGGKVTGRPPRPNTLFSIVSQQKKDTLAAIKATCGTSSASKVCRKVKFEDSFDSDDSEPVVPRKQASAQQEDPRPKPADDVSESDTTEDATSERTEDDSDFEVVLRRPRPGVGDQQRPAATDEDDDLSLSAFVPASVRRQSVLPSPQHGQDQDTSFGSLDSFEGAPGAPPDFHKSTVDLVRLGQRYAETESSSSLNSQSTVDSSSDLQGQGRSSSGYHPDDTEDSVDDRHAIDDLLEEAMDSDSEEPSTSAKPPAPVMRKRASHRKATEDGNLPFSINEYRASRNMQILEVKQTIVRNSQYTGMDVREENVEMPTRPPAPAPRQSIQERMKELQELVQQEQNVIMQTSNALNQCCSSTSYFAGSAEQVECNRILLIACQKRQAYMMEIQRLRETKMLDETGPGPKGSLTISDIRLPLKKEFVTRIGTSHDTTTYYFILLLRNGPQVICTQMLSTHDPMMRGSLDFPNLIKINGITGSFKLTLEIYSMSVSREQLGKDKKKKTPKKMKGSALTGTAYLGTMENLQSPGGPMAVRTTSFSQVTCVQLTMRSLDKHCFNLERLSHLSPLHGTVYMNLKCLMEANVEERGFLTMFEDVSGFGSWHRRWCALSGNKLQFWKYPDDETRKDPMGYIDLKRCVTEKIGLISRDVCARPNTFELVTVRQPRRGEKDTLVSRTYNTMTTIRNMLSADTKEERIVWCNKLNRALANIRTWHSDAMRPLPK